MQQKEICRSFRSFVWSGKWLYHGFRAT